MRAGRWALVAALAGAAAAGVAAHAAYRRELRTAVARVRACRRTAETAVGRVEFGTDGAGPPALVIHGAGGGFDQGLEIGGELLPGHHIVAPSRFGYLGQPIPADSSVAAQARAHVALLDTLGIERAIVMGISAGAPSAVELVLAAPERVAALLLVSPRTWEPHQVMGVQHGASNDAVLALMESSADFLYWAARRVARGAMVRFLGVPPAIEAAAAPEERARITQLMRTMVPLSQRTPGIALDGTTEICERPLAQVAVPTLLLAARDDLYRTLPGAEYTAAHIPGARLHVFETGGHLLVGRGDEARAVIREFLDEAAASMQARQAPVDPPPAPFDRTDPCVS